MPTGKETDADGNSMTASAQDQKNALPVRGTSALRKKALLENQIQREQAEAGRIERLKEDSLRKKKANRTKIINEYVNGVGEEEAKVMEKETTVEDVDEKAEEEEDRKMTGAEEAVYKETTVEDVDEKAEEEEDRKMTGAEEAAYQKRKAEEVEEGGIDDMDEGDLERSTSRQRIHSPKKNEGGGTKKATGQMKLNFKKISTMPNLPEGVAAAAGSDARAAQDAAEEAKKSDGTEGTSKLNPNASGFKPGIMKSSSSSEGVKFKRKKDPLATPSPAVGNKKAGSGVSWGENKTKTIPSNSTAAPISSAATVVGGNKRLREGGPEGSKKPQAPPRWTGFAYLEVTIHMESGLRADEVADKWELVLAKLLDKLRVLDGACCLLQPENIHGEGTEIYGKRQFPKVFENWDKYMDFEAKWGWSSPTPAERTKKLVVSCLMGTSRPNPKDFFNVDSRIDVGRVGDVSLFYKHVQHWKTARKLMLLYGPTTIPMTEYQKHATELLVELEKSLVKHKPAQFAADIHDKEWPEVKWINDWAKGTPFIDQVPGQRREDTSHRKTPTMFYPREDEDRIMAVARECKRLKMERRLFGQHAFFQEIPKKEDGEEAKEAYAELIRNHGAVQKSLGRAILKGLVRADVAVPIELMDDENGPRVSPGEYDIRSILMKLHVGDTRVFQAIFKDFNGQYVGFFTALTPACKAIAEQVIAAPSGFIKLKLKKRGFVRKCIKALIKKSFTPEAANDASLARMCRVTGRIISGAEIRRGEHNGALDTGGIINRMAGLTTDERRAMEMTDAVATGPAIILPEMRPGAMGAFDFGEEETVNTIHPRAKEAKSTCNTFLVDEHSMYTMETNDADVMEPEEMDAKMRAEDHHVKIDFGGFMNLGDDTEEKGYTSEYSSAASGISPCTLDNKLKGMSKNEVDVDSWGDMDLASKSSKSTRVEDEKSMDDTMNELKKDMEEAMTNVEGGEVDEFEDARETMEEEITAPPPDDQTLPDDGNADTQPIDGQLDRTSTATSTSLGSPSESLGDTEKPLQMSGEANEAGKTGDDSSSQA